jgi:hypothetical protein
MPRDESTQPFYLIVTDRGEFAVEGPMTAAMGGRINAGTVALTSSPVFLHWLKDLQRPELRSS